MASPLDTIEKLGISGPGILIVFLGIALGVAYNLSPVFLLTILKTVFFTAPIWLPPFLLIVFWRVWITSIQSQFINKQEVTLLEIRLPREITKSPLAMESVLSGIHLKPGETTFIDRIWLGKTRPWFSLEIISIEGDVRFFIWTRRFFKNIVEAQIYAQYPEVEIHEVDDYTTGTFFDPNKNAVWGCDFALVKPDPYPIKTYVDYGLDKETKEELKIDPIANLLEYLGTVGKGEQVWIQIPIQVTKSKWQEVAKSETTRIINEATLVTAKGHPGDPSMFNLTKGQTDIINAMERSVAKLGFDCGMRGIYIADKDKFNPTNIVGLIGTVKQFNSNTLNGFYPTRWMIKFDFPWQDYKQIRKNRTKRRVLDAYKRRSWFYSPYKTPTFVLNTEELATIFHFPGGVVQTPTVGRVGSKKAEAPTNLPT